MKDEAKELQKEFGLHIQRLRLAKQLSKTAFADLLGKERVDVSQIEKGERNVTLKTLLSLSKALEVPIVGLLDFSGHLAGIASKHEPKKTIKKKAVKKRKA